MFIIRPFLVALQFLTLIPVTFREIPDEHTTGQSILYYPVVGLLLGLLLAFIAWAGHGVISDGLLAALLLTFWIAITGALHLDGLADSADAWLGGLGDRERTLTIMKDPYCGPAAVVVLVLLLLLKFTALEQLVMDKQVFVLIVIPMLARTSLVLLFLTTNYVRDNGLGKLLKKYLTPRSGYTAIFASCLLTVFLTGINALWLILTSIIILVILRKLMLQRIGGMTGDTAGALVEITEVALLLNMAFIL